MIFFEAQKLPPYLGGIALAAITVKMGIESISSFSEALFGEKASEDRAPIPRLTHFWRGVKCLIPTAASAFSLYLLAGWAKGQTSKEETIISDEDFKTCRNELKEFQESSAYSDLLHPPGIDKFCREYLISLEAYTNFLSKGASQNKKIEYWVQKIQPYFSFLEWKDEAIDLSKKTFNKNLKICEEKFNWVQKYFGGEVLVGVKVDWSSICNRAPGERLESCEKYLKMKRDLNRFRQNGLELNSLISEINEFYKVSKCRSVLKLNTADARPLESNFKQIICSKPPFNQTTLCADSTN